MAISSESTNTHVPSKLTQSTSSSHRPSLQVIIVTVVLISLLVGGASGLLVSGLIRSNTQIGNWVDQNIFGRSPNAVTTTTSNGQTLSVTTEESATVSAVDTASPAVVSVVITQDLSKLYSTTNPNVTPFDDFFQFNFPQQDQPQGQQEVGAGTGFIITSDGMILTNKHVVSEQDAEYTVVMNDGTQYDASVLDTDPFNDLALLKIDAQDLPTVKLGDSDSLETGQTVIAIGNALGEYSNTVTRGVISGLSRTVTAGSSTGQSETLEDIIQTDAAINFGNSGGPLLNLAGEVIGVNTAISSQGQLVGFAIPVNQAKTIIESVQQYGHIVRPYLGVRYVLINDDIAKQNNLSVDHGALIIHGSQTTDLAIVPGSPADKAGLVENDIILEVNGQSIDENHSLAHELQKNQPGDTVQLKVLHKGEEKTISVTLEELSN